ncbi:zinc finger protein 234-like isoform X2 [Leguminivora glycinivorella]|uniref:zinc finger protein 234-like isoform X2 n=1 Tax=Leguminivora glycinivorella TaxID=1035111 RepID=UPI00200F753B|nr:zinc finger protein 234-like isoform X2 [Leguminivora glycinivorella]
MDISSESSNSLLCCRACLSTERRLFNIHECKLTDAFYHISGALVYQDYLPQHLCSFCRATLIKCTSFREMCLRTQQTLLPELYRGGEEQLEEIAARKKSRNYLESRYRCDDCGKGYDAEAAYTNHLLRHTTSMGQHPCEICSVRFKLKCRRQQHQDLHRLKFLCKECSFVSRTRSQAKRHHAMHAGKTYECQHCGKTFKMSSTYLTHVRRAHAALNVACDVCGETFVGEKGLKLHKKRTHSENMPLRVKCGVCSASFVSAEALSRHAAAGDHGARACEQCGENCASETQLQAHVAEMHPGELRRCEECGLTFASASAFDAHHRRKHAPRYKDARVTRKRHASRPPRGQFVCEQCGRILPNATLLRYHQRTHQDVKPYACSECPKTFALKSSLNFHMRSHTGERPFQCPLCPLAFTVKANLNRHHRTAHLKLHPRIPCSICGRVFTTNSCVRVHINTVHHGQPGPKRDRRKRKPDDPETVSTRTQ